MTSDLEHPWQGAAVWAKQTPEGLWLGSPHEIHSGGDVGNVDLWIQTSDGKCFWGVVFSIESIRDLMEAAVERGEFLAPVHYCLHSIVVPQVNEICVTEAVDALHNAGELQEAFYQQEQVMDESLEHER